MQTTYEVPELTLIGAAEDVVLGSLGGGDDGGGEFGALDFEFQQD
jgi:hypothetical protein